jgi:RNA polymerase sigma factor (sigma-70 family)
MRSTADQPLHPSGPPLPWRERPAGVTATTLVDALRRNEVDAMERVMAQYGRLVVHAARRVLRDGPEIDDVVQDTWLALAANVDRIREPARLPSWLWATATNAALLIANRRLRVSCADPHVIGNEEAAESGEVCDGLLAAERRSDLAAALATISEEERHLLGLLMATARPSYQAVAAEVGRPVGSLGPTRIRILAKLRTQMLLRDPS